MRIEDRAYTNEEKREVIEAVYQAWIKQNDIRLCQMIVNANGGEDPFHIEDFKLVEMLKS